MDEGYTILEHGVVKKCKDVWYIMFDTGTIYFYSEETYKDVLNDEWILGPGVTREVQTFK